MQNQQQQNSCLTCINRIASQAIAGAGYCNYDIDGFPRAAHYCSYFSATKGAAVPVQVLPKQKTLPALLESNDIYDDHDSIFNGFGTTSGFGNLKKKEPTDRGQTEDDKGKVLQIWNIPSK